MLHHADSTPDMLRSGHIILLCTLALLVLGVVMVNSALMTVAPLDANARHLAGITPRSIIFSRSTLYMVIALTAMTLAYWLPIRPMSRLATSRIQQDVHPTAGLSTLIIATLILLAILALVYVPRIGVSRYGASRWIHLLPGVTIQPSEIVKWAMLALIAWYATARTRWITTFRLGLLPALAAIGIVCFVIVLEDLGTAVLIAASATIILLAAGVKLRHYLCFVPLGLAGIIAAIITSPYRVKRILAFLDPFADPQGIGFHMIQSLAAIAGGNGPGRGLGHGFQKFGYLPEDNTDFLFAIVCEELGIAGAALVITLYAMLLGFGLSIIHREQDRFLKLLGLGIITTIGLQAAINLFVVTGMAPTKGIALPLMSSGGTGWILTAFCLGLLAAMDRTQQQTNDIPAPTVAAHDTLEEISPRTLKPRVTIELKPAATPSHIHSPAGSS